MQQVTSATFRKSTCFWWYSLVVRMRKVNAFCIEGKQQIVLTFPCPGRDGGSSPPTTAEYFEIWQK